MKINAASHHSPLYTASKAQPALYQAAPSLSQVDAGQSLHLGQQGPAVSRLQEQLNNAGAQPPLQVDGKFGANTDAATQAFQRLNGLEVDGKAGPLTHSALRNGASFEPAELGRSRDAARSRIGDANPEPRPQLSQPQSRQEVKVSAGLENANTDLLSLQKEHPEIKTNQDFINHCYGEGQGHWSGASEVAARYGQDLNTLVQNRQAPLGQSGNSANTATNSATNTAADATVAAGKVTNAHPQGAELEAFPIAGGQYNIGYDSNWNNFDAGTATHNSDYSKNQTNPSHPSGHLGVDIFAPRGQPVVSPVSGVVESINHNSSVGGNTVTVRRGDTRYYMAHLNEIENGLKPGQEIHAGEAIGTVGNTGSASSTAPHLHFSMYNGAGGYRTGSINPFPYLDAAR